MSLFKGFVCTAILFLPAEFGTGGWLFMSCMLFGSALLTIYCAFLLLEVRQAVDKSSYSDLGFVLYGNAGRWAVNVAVACSQSLFCCGYIYFIVSNMHFIFSETLGWQQEKPYTGLVCGFIFCLLCFFRKIEIFAATSTFANVMIFITLLYVIVEGANHIAEFDHGDFVIGKGTPPIASTFGQAIGFAVYSYEGIGVVLPI